MSEIVRSAGIIAGEINFIKRQTASACLNSAVEIGKLLCEAKETVPHGEWGKWLEDNVNYSTSTANNLMKLFNCYGGQKELSAFDENAMDIFGALSPSQALVLAALPEEKRVEYVETHDVENESVREMQKQIDELLGKNKKNKALIKDLNDQLKAQVKTVKEKDLNIKKLKSDCDAASARANDYFKELKSVNDRANAAEKQLKELSEKQPPNEETIRKEYEDKLQNLTERLKRAESSETQKFAVHFELFQNEFNLLKKMVSCWDPADKETSDRLRVALIKALDIYRKGMG